MHRALHSLCFNVSTMTNIPTPPAVQFATAGEALIDLIQEADGRLRPCAGGAVYNASRALALRGVCGVVDANLRPAIVADMAAYRASVLAALGEAYLIKVSDEDLVTLGMTDADPLVNARALLTATQAPWLALTLGAQGAMLLHRDGRAWHSVETAPVTVAGTVGAGDCFLAGLLVALLDLPSFQSASRVDALTLSEADVARLLGHAVASASLCVQQTGCVPPTLAQGQARLAAAPPTCRAV